MLNTLHKAAKSAVVLMVLTLISKIFGLFREITVAAYYGANVQTDAFFVASNFTLSLFVSIGAGLGTAFIPLYSSLITLKGEKKASLFVSNLINILVLVSIFLILLGFVFAPFMVRFFTPGFSLEAQQLTVKLVRILIPMLSFILFSNVATGILQSKDSFISPALIGIPYSIIVIICSVLFSKDYGIYTLAWATVLATISQALVQVPSLRKKYRYAFHLDLKDENIRCLGILVLPVLLGKVVQQLNTLVDRIIASGLVEGSISALSYSNLLLGFVNGIFVSAILTVTYPLCSRYAVKDDYLYLEKITGLVLTIMMIFLIPITVGAIFLREEVVKIVFQRGAFDHQATACTAYVLGFYALGLVAFGIREFLIRVFYSLKDTSTPMVNGIIVVGIKILLSLILVNYLAAGGLALATSVSGWAGTVFLLRKLGRKIPSLKSRKIWVEVNKVLFSSLIMGFVVWIVKQRVFTVNLYLNFSISVFVGTLVYFLMLKLLNVEGYRLFTDVIKSKILSYK